MDPTSQAGCYAIVCAKTLCYSPCCRRKHRPSLWKSQALRRLLVRAQISVRLRRTAETEHYLSFLPRQLHSYLSKISASHGELAPSGESFRGSVLFADASGFTKLTEALATRPHGAELLCEILNKFFTIVVNIIHQYGGDIIKFAGDAVLVVWTVGGNDSPATTMRQAVLLAASCSQRIHKRLEAYTISLDNGDNHRLSMHMGISCGDLDFLHVGGMYKRWEYVMDGPAFRDIAVAEPMAMTGTTVIAEAARKELQKSSLKVKVPTKLRNLQDGDPQARHCGFFWEIVSVNEKVTGSSMHQPHYSEKYISYLEHYIPAALKPQLKQGGFGHIAEIRHVSVAFVRYSAISLTRKDHSSMAHAVNVGHKLMLHVQEHTYSFEGSVNKLLVDDKGLLVLCVFGLPPMAHPDDPRRAVLAAMSLVQARKELGPHVVCSVGVATGDVFAGVIGAPSRGEYTVIGRTVNLAARLMQAGVNQVYVCDKTFKSTESLFRYSKKRTNLKGIGDYLMYEPRIRRASVPEVLNTHVMQARQGELAKLRRMIQNTDAGRVMAITGERGSGKLKLIQTLAPIGEENGFYVAASSSVRAALNAPKQVDTLNPQKPPLLPSLSHSELEPSLASQASSNTPHTAKSTHPAHYGHRMRSQSLLSLKRQAHSIRDSCTISHRGSTGLSIWADIVEELLRFAANATSKSILGWLKSALDPQLLSHISVLHQLVQSLSKQELEGLEFYGSLLAGKDGCPNLKHYQPDSVNERRSSDPSQAFTAAGLASKRSTSMSASGFGQAQHAVDGLDDFDLTDDPLCDTDPATRLKAEQRSNAVLLQSIIQHIVEKASMYGDVMIVLHFHTGTSRYMHDREAWSLVNTIARNCLKRKKGEPRMLLCVSSRMHLTHAPTEWEELMSLAKRQHSLVSLKPLTADDARIHLLRVLNVPSISSVPLSLQQYFEDMAAGNPKHIYELADHLKAAGVIVVEKDGAICVNEELLSKTPLPRKMFGYITSTLDLLDMDHLRVVKVASLCEFFTPSMLYGLFQDPIEWSYLRDLITALEDGGIFFQVDASSVSIPWLRLFDPWATQYYAFCSKLLQNEASKRLLQVEREFIKSRKAQNQKVRSMTHALLALEDGRHWLPHLTLNAGQRGRSLSLPEADARELGYTRLIEYVASDVEQSLRFGAQHSSVMRQLDLRRETSSRRPRILSAPEQQRRVLRRRSHPFYSIQSGEASSDSEDEYDGYPSASTRRSSSGELVFPRHSMVQGMEVPTTPTVSVEDSDTDEGRRSFQFSPVRVGSGRQKSKRRRRTTANAVSLQHSAPTKGMSQLFGNQKSRGPVSIPGFRRTSLLAPVSQSPARKPQSVSQQQRTRSKSVGSASAKCYITEANSVLTASSEMDLRTWVQPKGHQRFSVDQSAGMLRSPRGSSSGLSEQTSSGTFGRRGSGIAKEEDNARRGSLTDLHEDPASRRRRSTLWLCNWQEGSHNHLFPSPRQSMEFSDSSCYTSGGEEYSQYEVIDVQSRHPFLVPRETDALNTDVCLYPGHSKHLSLQEARSNTSICPQCSIQFQKAPRQSMPALSYMLGDHGRASFALQKHEARFLQGSPTPVLSALSHRVNTVQSRAKQARPSLSSVSEI
eukprot:m.53659 g.53659  ORF g.53659 m.53659 type:complete len:1616 (-) comp11375_c0_seq1:3019-7866(-)